MRVNESMAPGRRLWTKCQDRGLVSRRLGPGNQGKEKKQARKLESGK